VISEGNVWVEIAGREWGRERVKMRVRGMLGINGEYGGNVLGIIK
jgi:hypothetical protein